MITFIQWKQEQESLRRLREMVDRINTDIIEGRIIDEAELEKRIDTARAFCKGLLPDKLEVFKMIYESRFRRLWTDFGPPSGSVAGHPQHDGAPAPR